jgi:hypothetical protein
MLKGLIILPEGVERGSRPLAGVNLSAMNERVPERYFLVKNNDLVRVKYLLVYAEGKAEDRCVFFSSPS